MVLADGTLVHACETENPDLFWAVRGAAGNFGIILPYPALVDAPQAPHNGQGEPVTCSALVDHFTAEFAAAAARLIRGGESGQC
jgi:hypothetical protein